MIDPQTLDRIRRAIDVLRKIETQKLCVKAHEEEKNLRAMVLMKTKYSEEELDMIWRIVKESQNAIRPIIH